MAPPGPLWLYHAAARRGTAARRPAPNALVDRDGGKHPDKRPRPGADFSQDASTNKCFKLSPIARPGRAIQYPPHSRFRWLLDASLEPRHDNLRFTFCRSLLTRQRTIRFPGLLHVLVHVAGAVDHDQPDDGHRNKPNNQCHPHSSSAHSVRSAGRAGAPPDGQRFRAYGGYACLGNTPATFEPSAAQESRRPAPHCTMISTIPITRPTVESLADTLNSSGPR